MLNTLIQALGADESVTVSVKRDNKGQASIILTGRVTFDPDGNDESLRQLQAALARPLVIHLSEGEDADDAVREAISTFAAEQRKSRDVLADYKADQVSGRVSAQAAPKRSESKKSEPAKDAPAKGDNAPAPVPEAVPADDNPDSLF